MFRNTLKLSAIFIFVSSLSFGQTVIGKYGGEFLALGVGGRALGMGGGHVAVVNDVTAGYWNPAGLAHMNYPQISLMHEEHFGNLVNYNYGAVAIPYGEDMSFGISAIRLAIDDIDDTREALVNGNNRNEIIYDILNPYARIDPSKVTQFNNTDWAFYLTFAKRQTEDFYWGANVKIILRDIAEFSAFGIGFDVGAIYMPMENLTLGASLMDVTTTLVAWSTGRNELITPTAKIGAAYGIDFWGFRITPALDIDVRFENRRFASYFNIGPVSFDPHGGFELSYQGIVAIRAGYNDVKQFTAGAGIKLPKLNIDYSIAIMNEAKWERLPETHRLSIMLTLEEPRFLRDGL